MYNSITRARYNLVWPFLRHCAFSLSLSLCPFCFVLLYSLRLHVGTSLTLFCLCFSIFLSLYLSFPAYPYLAHLISQSALSANVYRPVIGTKGKIKADGASNVPTYSIYVHTYIRCIYSYFILTHTHIVLYYHSPETFTHTYRYKVHVAGIFNGRQVNHWPIYRPSVIPATGGTWFSITPTSSVKISVYQIPFSQYVPISFLRLFQS